MVLKKLTDRNFLPSKGTKAIPVYAEHYNEMYDGGTELDAKISVLNRRDHHSMDATHIIKHPLLAIAVYDFDVDGGATGTINLNGDTNIIPDNAIIRNVSYDVESAISPTGATATLIFSVVDGALLTLSNVSGGSGGLTGMGLGTPQNSSGGTWIKTAAARSIDLEITGGGTVEAGKLYCYVEYVVSELDAGDYSDTPYATFE